MTTNKPTTPPKQTTRPQRPTEPIVPKCPTCKNTMLRCTCKGNKLVK